MSRCGRSWTGGAVHHDHGLDYEHLLGPSIAAPVETLVPAAEPCSEYAACWGLALLDRGIIPNYFIATLRCEDNLGRLAKYLPFLGELRPNYRAFV